MTAPPDATAAANRRVSPARALALLLLAAILCIGLVEAVLWTLFPMRSGTRVTYSQSLPGVKSQIVYTADRYGLRSLSDWTLPKPAGTIRVLCLGASTTNQPTQSTEEIWSALLQKLLEAELAGSGVAIQVAAFGGGGQRVFNRVAWCHENLDRFDADVVVTLEGINDLCFNGGPDYSYAGADARIAALRGPPSKSPGLKRFLQSNSQLYRRAAALKNAIAARRALATGGMFEWHSKNLPELRAKYAAYPYVETLARDPDPIVEFGDGMDALLAQLSARGIAPIVLAQPTIWKETMSDAEKSALWIYVNTPRGAVRPGTAWLAREMARYNAVQRERAMAAGAAYVPLDEMLPKTLDVFFDDCHFTDAGNELVARAILPTVVERVRALAQAAPRSSDS
jgi:lysophospholipase L1-like esterase